MTHLQTLIIKLTLIFKDSEIQHPIKTIEIYLYF